MTSFWDHLYQYAQEHLVVRYLQEEPTGYGRLSIQTDARRRGLEDLLRGPAARSFRRLWEEQQELHSLEEQALFRAGREEFDRAAAELPGCAQELGELARCLDQLYFGGGAPAFSPARASELRRALRLASRPPERPARH